MIIQAHSGLHTSKTVIFIFLTSVIFSVSPIAKVSGQSFQWAQSGGGTGSDESFSATCDSLGNIYITGIFEPPATIASTALTGTGSLAMHIAKYNAGGSGLWAHASAGTGLAGGHVLASDPLGNIYVTGEFTDTISIGTATLVSAGLEDVFVAKYDALGNFLWAISGGSSGTEIANSIKADALGNVYLTGYFEDTLFFSSQIVISSGGADVFVLKVDASGVPSWLKRAGGAAHDEARGLALSAGTSIFISGYFEGNAVFGTTTLFNSTGSKDVFTAMLDTSGAFIWAKASAGNDNEASYDVATDNAGNAYVAGYFHDTVSFGAFSLVSNGMDDVFITKYNSTGVEQWSVRAGGDSSDRAYAIVSDGAGNTFVTGSFEDTSAFGSTTLISAGNHDIFTAAFNSSGAPQWALRAGGAGFDRGYGITQSIQGDILVTGTYEQSASFGAQVLNTAGASDLFLAKISLPTATETITFDENEIIIFPNPATDNITIRFQKREVRHIMVLNMLGEIVAARDIDSDHLDLDAGSLPKGIYFIKITNRKNNSVTGKIVKM